MVWHQTSGGAKLGSKAGRTGGMHWFVWVRSGGSNTYFENSNSLGAGSLSGTEDYQINEHSSIAHDPNVSRELLGWSKIGSFGRAVQVEPGLDHTLNSSALESEIGTTVSEIQQRATTLLSKQHAPLERGGDHASAVKKVREYFIEAYSLKGCDVNSRINDAKSSGIKYGAGLADIARHVIGYHSTTH